MDPIRLLEVQHQHASLESHDTGSLTHHLLNLVAPLQRGLSAFVGFFSPTSPAIGLKTNVPEFLKLAAGAPYTDTRTFNAFVPEGLSTTYLEYIHALEPAVVHALEVPGTLNAFATYLSLLMGRPEGTAESRSFASQYADLTKRRQTALDNVNKCFAKGKTTTTRKLGEVVRNNKEWTEVLNKLQALGAQMSKIDRKQIDNKIDECLGMLKTLRRQIEENPNKDVSPATLTNLSEGAVQVARELEFYSVIWYRVESLTSAVDQTLAYYSELEGKIRA